jgi:hypothetical protein
MNCGTCGNTCNAGESCMSGHCICAGTQPARACTSSETCCAGGTTPGGCFDLTSDHDHCHQCAMACGATEQCKNGSCTPTDCNPPCGNGNTCDPNTFTCKCGGAAGCADPQFCCGQVCTDRHSDPANCSTCGNDVSPNLCCNGTSTAHNEANCLGCGKLCPTNQLCCSGGVAGFSCVASDASNCGTCGNMCGKRTGGGQGQLAVCCGCGATAACSFGACTLQVCTGGGPDE